MKGVENKMQYQNSISSFKKAVFVLQKIDGFCELKY